MKTLLITLTAIIAISNANPQWRRSGGTHYNQRQSGYSGMTWGNQGRRHGGQNTRYQYRPIGSSYSQSTTTITTTTTTTTTTTITTTTRRPANSLDTEVVPRLSEAASQTFSSNLIRKLTSSRCSSHDLNNMFITTDKCFEGGDKLILESTPSTLLSANCDSISIKVDCVDKFFSTCYNAADVKQATDDFFDFHLTSLYNDKNVETAVKFVQGCPALREAEQHLVKKFTGSHRCTYQQILDVHLKSKDCYFEARNQYDNNLAALTFLGTNAKVSHFERSLCQLKSDWDLCLKNKGACLEEHKLAIDRTIFADFINIEAKQTNFDVENCSLQQQVL